MHDCEKIWIRVALFLTALDVFLPYTVFRKEGSWTFWIVLTSVALAGGIAYTALWRDTESIKARSTIS